MTVPARGAPCQTTPPRSPRRSSGPAAAGGARAAWIGSALEYYDFFIYGTAAALVFGAVFFPGVDPGPGTLLRWRPSASATRPDRSARSRWVISATGAAGAGPDDDRAAMGTSTFLVGCLPSLPLDRRRRAGAARDAAAAARILRRRRAGERELGELEHAPERQRAFFSSFTLGGTQAGQAIATATFIPIATLPQEHLLSWGWRIAVLGQRGRRRSSATDHPPHARRDAGVQERGRGGNAVAAYPARGAAALPLEGSAAGRVRGVIATPSTIFTVWALTFAVNTMGSTRRRCSGSA